MPDQIVTASISMENAFSGSVHLGGKFNFSISGTFVANVVVQRSYDAGVTWCDVADFAVPGEYIGEEPEKEIQYRFGIKTGGYTSGTVVGRLSQ